MSASTAIKAGLGVLAGLVFACALALAATSRGSAPVQMRFACAAAGGGQLRYVAAARCRRSERLVRFSSDAPVLACVVVGGRTSLVARGSACRRRSRQPVLLRTLPGPGRARFCAKKSTGVLRSIRRPPHVPPLPPPRTPQPDCRRDEREVFVARANRAPAGADDAATVGEDDPATPLDVLANDRDPERARLRVSGLDPTGATGAVALAADRRTVTYDPAGRFEALPAGARAADSFTYAATDGTRTSRRVTVRVTAEGANDSPRAGADSATTDEDTAVAVRVLADDRDADEGDALEVASVDTTGTRGAVTREPGGVLRYDPSGRFDDLAPGATATDRFRYVATDGRASTEPTEVTITVTGVADRPVARADTATTTERADVVVRPLANDSDPDSASLSITRLDTTGLRGRATLRSDGEVDYSPDGRFDALRDGETPPTSCATPSPTGR